MDDNREDASGSKGARRRIDQADKMLRSGRITAEEAARLSAAGETGDAERVIRDIRVRHAGARVDAAVAEGAMSREEADGFLDRIRAGEHSRGLRSHLAQFRPKRRSRMNASASSHAQTPGEQDSPA
jgi:polyhydroxyalkanoate synthesis regulator phasin